ncbi:RNA12 protein-domain-containing protein [Macrophomina phaseolina]|uniref:Mitochondrial escape protein 2 n=1 Tax=Macrophomina phaseolina TaxID=35725 RepID=A0ABQ8G7R8_9PEZI|nr:RNA12 protein-domain-containing protein [Macrophomina phaseolina]
MSSVSRLGLGLRLQPSCFGAAAAVPRRSLSSSRSHRLKSTLEAGENKSGHINVHAQNQAVLFFDHVFPLKLQWLLRFPFSTEKQFPELMKRLKSPTVAAADPITVLKSSPVVDKAKITIEEVLPRLKEGGAFVKITHDPSVNPAAVESEVIAHLKQARIKPWWNPFQRMRARLVRGRPWVEDLYRLPSTRLKVEFLPAEAGSEPAELSPEQLYSIFRPYGKLKDIVTQPPDSKIIPRYAYLDFTLARRAIMAKNCLHGVKIAESEGGGKTGTLLRLTYEAKHKGHWFRDWLLGHPRIVIPAVIAVLGTITVTVFDPIRTFFIKAHVNRSFSFEDNKVYNWFRSQATDILRFRRKHEDEAGMEAIWDDRKDNIEQLQTWLMESADTFIIVQGPRGSGKKELVLDQAIKHRKHKLVIDCKPIQEARSDSATINAAAAEVGYRPVFSWMNSISGMIDLAAQGAAGVKTGFSETLDGQLGKILNSTATALKQIALGHREKSDKDANLSDDDWLEVHPEKRPVVVVDNYLHKSQDDTLVYDKIADWAAGLTTANVAHVIFLTHDVSFSKSLSKALPDRVFRLISLSDCSPEVAKRFVISHLDADDDEDKAHKDKHGEEKKLTPSQRRKDLAELDECIGALGGRLTDLEFLARRIKTGESPKSAVQQIIEQSASEILKMYLIGQDGAERRWSPEQAWLLIKQLAAQETLRYNGILLNDTFKSGGERVLQALEQAELITIVSNNGRPHSIRPGKPVYQSAFRMLADDRVLKAKLDLAILAEQTKIETQSIDKYEAELKLLGTLPKQPYEIGPRIKWLLGKVATSQMKVENYERESAELKKVLQQEF